MELKNKRAWITGASSGIGRSLALALGAAGVHLVLSARDKQALESVRQSCPGNIQISIVPFDLEDPDSIPDLVEKVWREAGPIDILVNNAGISQRGSAKETLFEVDRRILNTNFLGPVLLTKTLLPYMMGRKTGIFVAVSSVMGRVALPLRSSYVASKHAMEGYFRSLRAEVGREGLRVLLVIPGYVRTDIGLRALRADGSVYGKTDNNQQAGKDPDKLAKLIVQAIRKEKREVFFGGIKERLALVLQRYAPTLLENILKLRPR